VVDEPSLADRILALLDEAGVDVAGHSGGRRAGVVISDRAPEQAGRPVVAVLDPADMIDALRAGAAAVLPASVTAARLRLAVEAVALGLAVMPDDVAVHAFAGSAPDAGPDGPRPPGAIALTPREIDVLGLLAAGASNKIIARQLKISIHTVKFHVASILDKLDATGRTDAVAHAVRLGLLML
jgi:DNA-binding NarL/FixJ family response regulator